MRKTFALAKITFFEGIRNRSLFGIALFSLFVLGLNVAISGFFMRDIGKVTVDMNMSALNFSGILLVFFVGLNLIAKDIEKKTIQIVLSKPISRMEYIFGKYFGIVFFTIFCLLLFGSVSSLTIFVLKTLNSEYFYDFSWYKYGISFVFILVKILLLSAIAVFFSTLTSSSFVALICSISVYIIGVTIEDVVFYMKSEIAIQEQVVSPWLEQLIGFVSYLCPNFSVFDFSIEAAHGLSIQPERVFFALFYAVVYITLLLLSAAHVFARREFY